MRHFDRKHILASAVPAETAEAGSAPPPRRALVLLTALLGGWLRRREEARRYRRDLNLLMEMNDHLLKDINVTRAEVRAMASRRRTR